MILNIFIGECAFVFFASLYFTCDNLKNIYHKITMEYFINLFGNDLDTTEYIKTNSNEIKNI